MGALPNVFPGYQSVTVPENREKFMKAWGVKSLPDKPGLVIPAMMEGLLTKKIRAFWVFGENLANAEPNIAHAEKCLGSAEFLVVQDIFPNETTRFAHVILPSASWCEDEGTFTSLERRVSMVRTIKTPPGIAKPNWWIFKKRRGRWGMTGRPTAVGRSATMSCPPVPDVRRHHVRPDRKRRTAVAMPQTKTTPAPRSFTGRQFTHGKGILKGIEWTLLKRSRQGLSLCPEHWQKAFSYHTRTQTGRSGMDFIYSTGDPDISIDDAREKNISDGDMVIVESRRGKVTVPARVSRIRSREVWCG
jgi:formate dehydrogenase major subunit